jgi:capsule polysaccharide export protein KpsE/RkpR
VELSGPSTNASVRYNRELSVDVLSDLGNAKENGSVTFSLRNTDVRQTKPPSNSEHFFPEGIDQRDEREIDFDSFEERWITRLRLLWSKRKLLGRVAAIGLVCGAVIALLLRSEYQSSVQLMPPDGQSGSGMAMLAALTAKTGGAISGLAGDLLGVKGSGDLFVGMLRTRTVEDRLIQKFDLRKAYRVKLEEDARKDLEKNTGINADRKSGIISITVTDRNPQRAAALAQAYVDELDALVAQVSVSSARRERMFLEERLKTVKIDLDQASQDLSQFSSKNGTIDLKEQGRAMVEGAAKLQGELIAAESELKGLMQIYAPNNVRVRSVQARVSELRSDLDKIGGSPDVANAADDAKSAGYPSIRQLPILAVTYADLYRRTKVQEAVYETLTQEYELAKVQEAKETPSVRILDEPVVPERKSFPPRTLITLACGLLAFCGGVLLVLARSKWQQIDPGRPSKVFADEMLHSVAARMPWAPPNGSRLHAATHYAWLRLVRRSGSSPE